MFFQTLDLWLCYEYLMITSRKVNKFWTWISEVLIVCKIVTTCILYTNSCCDRHDFTKCRDLQFLLLNVVLHSATYIFPNKLLQLLQIRDHFLSIGSRKIPWVALSFQLLVGIAKVLAAWAVDVYNSHWSITRSYS